MVFLVMTLSWKGISGVYHASSVDISERYNPQSSASMAKNIFLLMILVNSHSVAFMSYEEKCLVFTLTKNTCSSRSDEEVHKEIKRQENSILSL